MTPETALRALEKAYYAILAASDAMQVYGREYKARELLGAAGMIGNWMVEIHGNLDTPAA